MIKEKEAELEREQEEKKQKIKELKAKKPVIDFARSDEQEKPKQEKKV